MNPTIKIREALPNEFNIIADIAHRTWPEAYGKILSNNQISYMLDLFYSIEALNKNADDGHRFLLLFENDTPMGFAGIEHRYKGMPITRIHKLYVLPETQGKGYGRLLLGETEKLAKSNQSEKISLNVNRSNPALTFYQKFGFKSIASEDIDIGEGYLMEDYIMEKTL